MREQFLQSFSKTVLAGELIDKVLQPELEIIRDVNEDVTEEYQGATNGEIFMGKKIAASMIQNLIDDIETYKDKKVKKKDPKNNY